MRIHSFSEQFKLKRTSGIIIPNACSQLTLNLDQVTQALSGQVLSSSSYRVSVTSVSNLFQGFTTLIVFFPLYLDGILLGVICDHFIGAVGPNEHVKVICTVSGSGTYERAAAHHVQLWCTFALGSKRLNATALE